jgi:hypothetical protein
MQRIVLLIALTACSTPSSDRDGAVDDRDAGPTPDGARPRDGGDPGDAPVVVEPTGCEDGGCSWCDPATWGGTVPTATTDVVIEAGTTVVVDCDATARTLTIEPGGMVFAARLASSTLTMHGNLVVRGVLDYGTVAARIPEGERAEIVFADVNDDAYVGTPTPPIEGPDESTSVLTTMEVLASDVGIWVMGDGLFAAAGTEVRAWGRLLDDVGPGDPTFTLDDATGWRAGDRVVLTPTDPVADIGAWSFDEATIASIDGDTVTLEAAPPRRHAGCTDCVRRGEAANLSRNVVIRSADDGGHAHVMVAERGVANLDSIELRWLGPSRCGGVERRAPLWFHQQGDDADPSFVRHASIWGGDQHVLMIERSNGIEVTDVAGYDSAGFAFRLFYDTWPCITRCADRNTAAPAGTVFDHVLAAQIAVPRREEDCARIDHLFYGIDPSGAEGSGVRDSVATGVGWDGSGETIAAFGWRETGSGRPVDFVFDHNVAHNNPRNGAHVWHNTEMHQAPYDRFETWSNGAYGVHWGAYQNTYTFADLIAVDNGLESIGLKAVPFGTEPRIDGATIDDITVLSYVFVQEAPALLRGLTFTGDRDVGVTQLETPCTAGDEDDPNDPDCLRAWIRFESPSFPAGMLPFRFGHPINRHTLWEVRGFSSPDHPSLPADFDLHRADNHVAGGSYYEPFDAWLVPR